MRVTVFGGSSARQGEPAYIAAQRLGELLGAAGYTILSGGYTGTMEAVSRGANHAGGHVIGVTCDEIEAWRSGGANRWVQEEMRFKTQRQRLFGLIENCDAALVLPGGIGTLAELAEMWSHMQTGAIPSRPLILIGPGWSSVIERFLAVLGDYVPEKSRKLLDFAENVDIAFAKLSEKIGDAA